MAFHYVDRIYEYEPFKYIRGLKNVTRNEQFFYWLPNGERVLSPAVLIEAMCQLGGWLKMVSTDFERRPVLLADEKSEYLGLARPGDQIDLEVEVIDFGDDVVVTKGTARIDGEPVLIGHCCRGYLLPLKDFDDPEKCRREFENLYRPEFTHTSRLKGAESTRLKAIAGHHTFESLRFIDGIIEHTPYKAVKGFKNFSACETFFESHFPRKPCVPGVLLTTFVGEVCQYLVKETIDAPLRQRAVVPTFIENVRFRKFVEPGDQCVLDCKIISGDASVSDSNIVVRAVIFANGNRVMVADMGFKTMHFDKVMSFTNRRGAQSLSQSDPIVNLSNPTS